MNKEEILLIEKYIDGELSAHQQAELLHKLREQSEFRQQCTLALQMKGVAFCTLHDKYGNLEDSIMLNLDEELSPLEESVMQALPENFEKPPLFKLSNSNRWLKLALAAQILLLPILYFILTSDSTSDHAKPELLAIATVSQHTGQAFIVRGDKKINIKKGDKLYDGDQFYVQDESSLALTYDDGSLLKFNHESFVRLSDIDGQKKVELFSGLIEADIQKQLPGKQMIILTEHCQCDVLGTKFRLSSSDVSSLLDVKHGEVRLNDIRTQESLIVPTNHFALANEREKLSLQESNDPLYQSPLVTADTPDHQVEIEVPLHKARQLFLVVNDAGRNGFDHSVWLHPRLVGPKGELDLTTLPWKFAKVGWADIKINTGYFDEPIKVDGHIYPKGISAHATSLIAWDIPPGYDTFKASGALLSSGIRQKKSISAVKFEVYTSRPERTLKNLQIRPNRYR